MGTVRYTPSVKGVGEILISARDGFIAELYFIGGRTTPDTLTESQPKPEDEEVLRALIGELDAYFLGKLREFSVPIKPEGTDFRKKVWAALQTIPYGETISYKELAMRINQPKAIRAVGGANHNNLISIIIPCHRAIGANGKLVGYGGGMDVKEFLLGLEKNYPTMTLARR